MFLRFHLWDGSNFSRRSERGSRLLRLKLITPETKAPRKRPARSESALHCMQASGAIPVPVDLGFPQMGEGRNIAERTQRNEKHPIDRILKLFRL